MLDVPKPSAVALRPGTTRRLAAARILTSFGRQEVVMSTPWLTMDSVELMNQLGDLMVFHSVCRTKDVCLICEGLL
jgi:hypothetical protein